MTTKKIELSEITKRIDPIVGMRDNWYLVTAEANGKIDALTAGSTDVSAMYTMDVDADTVIKGSVAVSFTASAVASALSSGATNLTSRGASPTPAAAMTAAFLFPMIIGSVLKASNPGITDPLKYNYTVPMCVFASLGVAALLLGLYLKIIDRKGGYGLEEPNIKEEPTQTSEQAEA